MKFQKYLVLTTIAILFGFNSFAQRGGGPHKEDIDAFKSKKIAFITEKLNLTPQEAQQFWPVYNLFEQEKWEAQKERRDIEQKVRDMDGDVTDKQILEFTQKMVDTHFAEAELMKKYNKKFLEILSPKKVLKLYQAEQQFRVEMIKQFRDRRPD